MKKKDQFQYGGQEKKEMEAWGKLGLGFLSVLKDVRVHQTNDKEASYAKLVQGNGNAMGLKHA